jgi:Fic family protein
VGAKPQEIPVRSRNFCDGLNSDEAQASPIVEFVSRAHYEFAAIHPFVDGNGRCARLLMNLLLIRKSLSFPIAIIHLRDHDALVDASSGDFVPFQDLIAEAIVESLRRAISFFS